MASGVAVADEVKDLYNTMKVNRSTDDAQERIRVVVFGLSDDRSEIIVREKVMEKDLKEKGNVFKYVQSLMKEGECKYILYDCHYETVVTKKEDLIFIMWICDSAVIKDKMMYSSSKSRLKQVLSVKFAFEMTDQSDTTLAAFADKLVKEKIVKLEDLDVK